MSTPMMTNSAGSAATLAPTNPRAALFVPAEVRRYVQAARAFYPRHRGSVGTLIPEGRAPMYIKSGHEGGPWGGTQRGGVPRGVGNVFTSGAPHELNMATHVEGHAAAIMWQQGIRRAYLFVDRMECQICARLLPMVLPSGAELWVVSPGQSPTLYRSAR